MWKSARKRKNLNFYAIFRDYTPQFIKYNYYSTLSVSKLIGWSHFVLKDNLLIHENSDFAYYLAGLTEGDGTIIVPKTERSSKGKINYPTIQTTFDSRDLPFVILLQKKN